MTSKQVRILMIMTWLNIAINGACLAACWYSDHQLEKQGITIENILAEGTR